MIVRFGWLALIALLSLAVPMAAAAQDAPVVDAELSDADIFDRLAQRAEELAARQDPSAFAIGRLRSELVVWRDQFLGETDVNARRIETVNQQIAALGLPPEDSEEPAEVAARRSALAAQLRTLRAPGLLAQEAYARANGLIGEFDAILLQRETAALGQRSPSPLNPIHLVGAIDSVWVLGQAVTTELRVGIAAAVSSSPLGGVLPRAALLFFGGIGLIWFGRRVAARWQAVLLARSGHWPALLLFLVSLFEILIPMLGLIAITEALQLLQVFGLRSGDMLEALPVAGGLVIVGWWLAGHIFPHGDRTGVLDYDASTRRRGRRTVLAIVWVLAGVDLLDAGLRTIDISSGALAALYWPLLAITGALLWRIGSVIKTAPVTAPDGSEPVKRKRNFVAQACTIVAVVAPVIALFGYVNAALALLVPFIFSLGLIGTLLLIQRLAHSLVAVPTVTDSDDDGRGLYALLPVFITLVIYAVSLPVFALIWGARIEELTELWTRFREGFTIGETQISPSDFVMFAAVFALGYVLTRVIQGALRKSVLPRTRFDIGGQNAIVAGVGYVGIILAAIIAITSAGIDLSSIAIVAGALSVGIGFGLQNIVSNFVSGIILLIERPVSEGDWIEVAGQMGYVRAISVRSTRIETFDRTDVIIPNADLVSGQVTNWTRGNLVGRVIVPVGVAYGTDIDKVTEILRGIAEAHPLVIMSPPPAVLFIGFGADSLDFEIRAILRDVNYVLVTKSEMNHAIAKQFAEAGIEIPFAQRDIWLRNPEVLKGAV